MEKEKYNFYLIGQKRAQDFYDEIQRYADEIGKNYGLSAKRDFLFGVASKTPIYPESNDPIEIDKIANVKDK